MKPEDQAEKAPETSPAAATPKFEDITLEEPITRGNQTIASIQLRKPHAGELRGLDLQDLMTGDINALLTLITRISAPALTTPEVEKLSMSDLAQCTGAVRGFLMTKQEQEALGKFLGVIQEQPSTN